MKTIQDVKFGTILSAYGIQSVVVGLTDEGVLHKYQDGGEEFTSWTTLEYRLETRDTYIVR